MQIYKILDILEILFAVIGRSMVLPYVHGGHFVRLPCTLMCPPAHFRNNFGCTVVTENDHSAHSVSTGRLYRNQLL